MYICTTRVSYRRLIYSHLHLFVYHGPPVQLWSALHAYNIRKHSILTRYVFLYHGKNTQHMDYHVVTTRSPSNVEHTLVINGIETDPRMSLF